MNTLVDVRFTIDVPEEKCAELVGRPDDDSDEWFQDAGEAAKDYVENNLMDAIDKYATDMPRVEVS